MGDVTDFRVGQTVELQDGRIAKIQFAGETQFAGGYWLGVELDDASGKNDGAVQGQRYFDCKPGYGMFVRPSVAVVLTQPTPKPSASLNGKGNGVPAKARPQSIVTTGLRRQSTVDSGGLKRQSINSGSSSPGGRAFGRLGSPSKSPTKQSNSSQPSGGTTRDIAPAVMPQGLTTMARAHRTFMAPPPSVPLHNRSSRQSTLGTVNGSAKSAGQFPSSNPRASTNRLSLRPITTKRFGSIGGESASAGSGHNSPPESLDADLLSPQVIESQDEKPKPEPAPSSSLISATSPTAGINKSTSSRGRSPPAINQRILPTPSSSHREVEGLKAKLRIMEKKRMEDRAKLKSVELMQAERDRFENIIQKLQAKYQPMQQEISDLKRQIKEGSAKYQELESQQVENETVVEVATLDREMAEETAESLKTELDMLRQKHDELELEVEVLREENEELGKEMSPEEKTSQGWLQMERSNERLREALIRLRDITQHQEADLRRQVAELERDVQELEKVKANYIQTQEKLAQSDSAVEDLRQQLDTALGAEEMIEELTEKNFSLSEQVQDLRSVVEDLESLREVNDELEINHTETERQMQEEIDYHEGVLADQSKKSALQQETIHDLEYTLTRFRNLVTSMQNDLEDMRASQQITENQANEMTSRSKAMMTLNMRLQASASKAQTKAIDLELGRLETEETTEHLKIVHLFLPESFKIEQNSILAFLAFKRIRFKAHLMHWFIKERISTKTAPGEEGDIFRYCDILDKLIWVASMCDRFINYIQVSTLEAFGRLEGTLYELEPVERAFTVWIDRMKQDELKEEQCGEELRRSIALLKHLAEVHIGDGLEQYADEVYMRALMMQSNLDNTAIAISHIKNMAHNRLTQADEDTQEDQASDEFFRKTDALIMQIRSAKVVAGKTTRQLTELKKCSLTLDTGTTPAIEQTQLATSELAISTLKTCSSIFKLLHEDRNTALTYQEFSQTISSFETQPFSSLSPQIHSVTAHLQVFYNLTNNLTQTKEFSSPSPPPPWQLLAQNMRAASATSAAYEKEVGRLKDEMTEKNTSLALREKEIEELSVKVEVLANRVGESIGRREKARELESAVESARVKEQDLLSHLAQLQRNLGALESEREIWKKTPQHQPQPVDLSNPDANNSPSSLRQIQLLKSEIAALQASMRYLRSVSHNRTLASSLTFLSVPLIASPPAPRTRLQSEAADVLREMLHLTTRPENRLVRLKLMSREDRLKWRPTRETSQWVLSRQTEEWHSWEEWRDGVTGKAMREEGIVQPPAGGERAVQGRGMKKLVTRARVRGRSRAEAEKATVIARVETKVPMGAAGNEVRVVRPGEWEEVVRVLGISGSSGGGELGYRAYYLI